MVQAQKKQMAYISLEEFVGNGCLKSLVPKLTEDGWDDVPTLKLMNSDDMISLNFTQEQKDALEMRTYLHDHGLMEYADKLEGSKKSLPHLLNMSISDISATFGMKRGHIARFMNKTHSCPIDPNSFQTRKQNYVASRSNTIYRRDLLSVRYKKSSSMTTISAGRSSSASNKSIQQSMSELKIQDGHIFKGLVASMPAHQPRSCGCMMKPPAVIENVAPLSAIEKISVQKLTLPYQVGSQPLVKTKTPPMKASELWLDKPAVILCIRYPGCIMFKAEAHHLYSRKPLFDALGVQLLAVIHEYIEEEVKDFWPRYWGGVVLHDKDMKFFKALGGGKLVKDKFKSGLLLSPKAIANYSIAKTMGTGRNSNGECEVKGGLFIVGKGKSGIAYQFVERNFGDWAPLSEVLEICSRLQKQNLKRSESMKY